MIARTVWTLGNQRQSTTVCQLDSWGLHATYPGVPMATVRSIFTPDNRSLIQRIGISAIRWNYSRPAEPGQPAGHADEAWSLVFSPDGSILASGSDDTDEKQTIKLWDVTTGAFVRGWCGGPGTVSSLAVDRSGKLLASGHLSKDGEVRLWDVANGQRLGSLTGHTDYVRTLHLALMGSCWRVAAGTDKTIRLMRDVGNWSLPSSLEGPFGRRLSTRFCPRRVVAGFGIR